MISFRFILSSIFLITTLTTYSQKELQITYKIKSGEYSQLSELKSILRSNHSSAFYMEIEQALIAANVKEPYRVEYKHNRVFKDLNLNTMQTFEDDRFKVSEEMNLFKWKFYQETDTILNYPCMKAEASFRGRDYIAWFTTKIPFRAAPWKIHGLPGVVLKVETTDKFYLLEASKLSIIPSQKEIKMPFKNKDQMNWDNYSVAYRNWIDEREENWRALEVQYGTKYYNAYPKLEILIEKNRDTYEDMVQQIIKNQKEELEAQQK